MLGPGFEDSGLGIQGYLAPSGFSNVKVPGLIKT